MKIYEIKDKRTYFLVVSIVKRNAFLYEILLTYARIH